MELRHSGASELETNNPPGKGGLLNPARGREITHLAVVIFPKNSVLRKRKALLFASRTCACG